MNKNNKIILPLLFTITLIIGMFIGYKVSDDIPNFKNILVPNQKNTIDEIMFLLKNRYVEKINSDSIITKIANEITSTLDPHSTYIPPKYLEEINEELDGRFEGIGIEYGIFKDTAIVLRTIIDGPAFKAGLKIGDRLIEANDSLLISKNKEPLNIKKFIKGPIKTIVKLKILRNNKIIVFDIKRDFIPIKSIPINTIIDDTIGYIKIDKFIKETAKDFILALQNLKSKNIKNLILDLRNNRGGLLDEAIEIADELLSDDKLIVYTKGEHSAKKEYKCRRKGLYEDGKLIVLLNNYSASASEVLAGALQDWDRAIIIGTNSFGKGLVQEQFDLSNGAALRLTIAKYYTPSGRCIQRKYKYNEFGHPEYLPTNFEDTTVHTLDTFKTVSGKFVFADNGLKPDIFVLHNKFSKDTIFNKLKFYNYFLVYANSLLHNNVNNLLKYQSITDFLNNYNLSDNDLNVFINLLKNTISKNEISEIKKQKIIFLNEIKEELLKLIWSEKESFKYTSKKDNYIFKALEVIKK